VPGATRDDSAAAREVAARAAVELIEPGMTLGLGSGRAVWRVVEGIAERFEGPPPVRAVAASDRTHDLVRDAGIEIVELDGALRLDLALDGADELDSELRLLKGGGGALLREKIVVEAAERFVVVAEAAKLVDRLGSRFPLPVEVVRFGWRETRRRLLELLPRADLRSAGEPPFLTDEGHYLLDCELPEAGDLHELAHRLKAAVGVVEHGLFLDEADVALLGRPDGGVEELTRA
jgi:ribose 5-phosphate isomerase A